MKILELVERYKFNCFLVSENDLNDINKCLHIFTLAINNSFQKIHIL